MISRCAYDNLFTVSFPERNEWKDGFQHYRKRRLIWYTNTGDGTGVYSCGARLNLSFSLQAEKYAIKACVVQNLGRDYKNRKIYILSDSQSAIKNSTVTRSTPYWFGTAINRSWNWLQLIWIPTHEDIQANKIVDQLAKLGPEFPFIASEQT